MTKVIETHPELEELLKEFKTETVAEEALRILEPIPEDEWCTGMRINDYGQCCSLGHYSMKQYGHPAENQGEDGPLTRRLIIASNKFLGCLIHTIATVNNMPFLAYRQPTPKQRVMALLSDMIKAGY